MNPRSFTLTCVFSRPRLSLFGRRPTETSTRSNSSVFCEPSSSYVIATPEPLFFAPLSAAPVMIAFICFFSFAISGLARSGSAPARMFGSASSTVTSLPSAA